VVQPEIVRNILANQIKYE